METRNKKLMLALDDPKDENPIDDFQFLKLSKKKSLKS